MVYSDYPDIGIDIIEVIFEDLSVMIDSPSLLVVVSCPNNMPYQTFCVQGGI